MDGDEELLGAWRAGDTTAGSALFDRHFPALYRFFRNKVDDGAEDLIQQTFLALVEGRDRFRHEAGLRTYLFVIARRLLRDHWQQRRRHAGDVELGEASVAALSTSPSRAVARRQEHRLLIAALRRLPLDLQIALELHYWEQLSGPQIAEVLGVPEGTVRSRLQRARERLGDELLAVAEPEDAAALESSRRELDLLMTSLREVVEPGTEGT